MVIGGVALGIQSAAYITYDIDVCYSRTRENLLKLANALVTFNPKLRGFPKDLPFVWDAGTLANGTNFTLETDIGDFDLLGEVEGIGTYSDVLATSDEWNVFGYDIRILSIDGLIRAKEKAGREKDQPGLKILYALREARQDEE